MKPPRPFSLLVLMALVPWIAVTCTAEQDRERGPAPNNPDTPDKPDLIPDDKDFMEEYEVVMQEAREMEPVDFQSRYEPVEPIAGLSYDPLSASFVSEIGDRYTMDHAQRELLGENGFVVLEDIPQATFEQAYAQLYEDDMPLLVTTDSLLYALHRSYDSLLKRLELTVLVGQLDAMLQKMHRALGAVIEAGALSNSQLEAAFEVDIYLTVARSLLNEEPSSPVTGEDAQIEADKILAAAASLTPGPMTLFGNTSPYDFSQMKPRGHYEDDPVLSRYFGAMMWLGRTEMAIVTFDTGDAKFNRRAFDAAFIMNVLLSTDDTQEHWDRINLVIELLVGERDSMNPIDLAKFQQESGIGSLAALDANSDEELTAALLATPYGIQRIMSQIIFTDPNEPQVVLPRVFLLMGQRFVIDSYVFHHVTYDRLVDPTSGTKITRMLPDPLDVQFALGSNPAAELLADEFERYPYQGKLHQVRFLVESHPQEFWDANLYNGWLNSTRALNDHSDRDRRPESMQTRAWDHKVLNTQMASWAELRHDTILYAKQSYSGGITCEYPDAYVEPYPLFYNRMGHLASLGIGVAETLEAEGFEMARVKEFFDNMQGVMTTLEGLAKKELAEDPLDEAEWNFLRGTVEREMVGCGEEHFDGWFPSLFFDATDVANYKPIIADVHTAPTDEEGAPVGWVMHGATGGPRLMVFTMTDCEGARAFVGPVSTYYTVVTEDFTRHTDSEWMGILNTDPPSRPGWTESFVR